MIIDGILSFISMPSSSLSNFVKYGNIDDAKYIC